MDPQRGAYLKLVELETRTHLQSDRGGKTEYKSRSVVLVL